ncbi:MAG: redoxin domain-containing protein [Desulfobacterales bacterium]|nr:redoxin domain-containing protein [Desulfobacterales bacterium]
MKTLQEQLEAIQASTASKMTSEIIADMKQGYEELAENKVLEKALNPGDTAPAFTLPNSQGNMIRSQDLLTKGPLVVLFYRGKW